MRMDFLHSDWFVVNPECYRAVIPGRPAGIRANPEKFGSFPRTLRPPPNVRSRNGCTAPLTPLGWRHPVHEKARCATLGAV